jgi:hypothetical protein
VRRYAAAPAVLLLALAAACGGEGDRPGASPAPATPGTPAPATTPPGPPPPPAEGVFDLAAGGPLTTIHGADSGDFFNDLPLLVTGDVNGDGLADLLIGARFGDGPGNEREDSGEAYLIFGRETLPGEIDLAVPEVDAVIYGAEGRGAASPNGGQLGYAGFLADVNRDGLDDIVLGAPFVNRPGTQTAAGAVYVIFGGREMPPVIDLALEQADVTLLGATAASFFGDALAAGDVNGDGVMDIIAGAPFQPRPADRANPGQMAGAVYVFFGSAELAGTRDTAAAGGPDLVIYGEEVFQGGDEIGDMTASGDLNGDGIDDIVMTAEAADGPGNARSVAGDVYVVYGSPGIGGVLDIAEGDQDVTIYGAEQNDTLGYNLAVADLTGDGIEDLIVVARGGDGPSNRTPEGGEVHIFAGGSLPETIDLAGYPGETYVYGNDPGDFLGNAAGGAGLDGSGVNALFVGAPGAGGPAGARRAAGALFFLDAAGLSSGVRAADAPLKLTVYGANANDALGTSAAAGDMTGDGRLEVIVLAMRSSGPAGARPEAGQVYIIAPGAGR